jgi:hypothetical protein
MRRVQNYYVIFIPLRDQVHACSDFIAYFWTLFLYDDGPYYEKNCEFCDLALAILFRAWIREPN